MLTHLISLLFLFGCISAHGIYKNDKVVRFNLTTKEQANILWHLEEKNHVDVWSKGYNLEGIDIRIPKSSVEKVEKEFFQKHKIKYTTIIQDVQQLIDEEAAQMKKRIIYDPNNKNAENDFFNNFRTIAEINAWLMKQVQQNPKLVTLINIGKSHEGRDILGIKIAGGVDKPISIHHGALHAREWISASTVLFMTNELITKYNTDPNVKMLVDNMEWHLFPVLNVDGYAYTHTNERLWRKTRRPNQGSNCVGTDPNRNFEYEWGRISSGDPCSNIYHGPQPWSENCIRHLALYAEPLLPRFKGYVDWHCYGQLFMRPWGYTQNVPTDEQAMKRIGDGAAQAISAVRGKVYRSGRFASILYPASGTSVDYFYGQLKVLSFTPELGTSFTMPANEIVPIGRECFEGLKAFGKLLLDTLKK